MTGLYDRDIVDALARNVMGKPSSVCTWQELLTVRDVVAELLNGEINRQQYLDPGRHPQGSPDAGRDRPAGASPTPVRRVGSTTSRDTN